MRKHRRRALIIGGSMSGLFAALYLRRCGWDADVFERFVSLRPRAGIMTHPEMREALAELGIDSSSNFSGCPLSGGLCWIGRAT